MFFKKKAAVPKTDSERNLEAAQANGSAILTATGVAVGVHLNPHAREKGARIEAAMHAAIAAAQAEGVTDPAELRNRMLIARDQVLGGG